MYVTTLLVPSELTPLKLMLSDHCDVVAERPVAMGPKGTDTVGFRSTSKVSVPEGIVQPKVIVEFTMDVVRTGADGGVQPTPPVGSSVATNLPPAYTYSFDGLLELKLAVDTVPPFLLFCRNTESRTPE